MKTILSCFFALAMLFTGPVQAQESNSLLWEISGNGLEEPSYLFGTIHLICPDDLELDDRVRRALDRTEQLVLELDMDDPEFATEVQRLSVNEGMENLSGLLNEPDLETLNRFFTEHYQADMSQLGIMKPVTLLSMMFLKGLDCPQPGSYELALIQHAAERDREVLGLETVTEQLAIFELVPDAEKLGWLVGYARDEDRFRENIRKMIEYYKEERIGALHDIMSEYPEYKVIEEELLYDRNAQWIDPIIDHASEKPSFFAVGAAHLASDRGLIRLLQREGYSVTPVAPVN